LSHRLSPQRPDLIRLLSDFAKVPRSARWPSLIRPALTKHSFARYSANGWRITMKCCWA
jgi:hypothetical protein